MTTVSRRQPRILMVCQPPDGGAAANASELAMHLSEVGFAIEYAGPPDARAYDRLERAGVEVHRLALSSGFRPDSALRAARSIRRLMRERSIDLVHSHSAPSSVPARLATARTPVAAVYSPHCFPFVGQHSRARRSTALAVERGLSPLTDRYLCCCEDERRTALVNRIAPAARLAVVSNGVAPCPRGVGPNAQLEELRGDGVLVGTISALREQKRIDVLIDATPRILAQNPSARVAIVGDGERRADLERQARRLALEREPRFAMLPFESEPAVYLRTFDVFALPSAWEGLPLSLLEALACGVPQVATDVGGSPEAVTDATGVIVAPGDPASLAEAIGSLLSNPSRRAELAAGSRSRYASRFTLERMLAETADLYRDVLAEKSAHPS